MLSRKYIIPLLLSSSLLLSSCSIQELKEVTVDGTSIAQTKAVSTAVEVDENKQQALRQNVIKYQAKVVDVADGDTFTVLLDGKKTTVRMLLIDTPESRHPKMKGPQPFALEASAFTKELLTDKVVELEPDVSDKPDRYGRRLFYVYVDGKSVQEELLRLGLARVAYVFEPNVKYVDRYREIEAEAKKKGLGIWSVETYAREDGFHPEVFSN